MLKSLMFFFDMTPHLLCLQVKQEMRMFWFTEGEIISSKKSGGRIFVAGSSIRALLVKWFVVKFLNIFYLKLKNTVIIK